MPNSRRKYAVSESSSDSISAGIQAERSVWGNPYMLCSAVTFPACFPVRLGQLTVFGAQRARRGQDRVEHLHVPDRLAVDVAGPARRAGIDEVRKGRPHIAAARRESPARCVSNPLPRICVKMIPLVDGGRSRRNPSRASSGPEATLHCPQWLQDSIVYLKSLRLSICHRLKNRVSRGS